MDLHSGMDLQLTIGEALGTDYFGLREPFTPQQEDYLTRTRAFVDTEVLPVINDYWERAEFPFALIEKMAGLGIIGDGIEGYGCPPMDPTVGRADQHGAQPRRRQPGHLPRRAGRAGDAVDRKCRLRGAEAALAAADGPAGEDRRVRADRTGHGSDSVAAGDRGPPRRGVLRINGAQEAGSATGASPTSWSCGRATPRTCGQGIPGREGHPGLRRATVIDGQGVAARGVAGRHRPRPTCASRRRTGCRGRTPSPTAAGS